MPTHAVSFLNQADNVIIMKKGRIVAYGTPLEINDQKDFQEILKIEHKKSQERESSKEKHEHNEDEEIINKLKIEKKVSEEIAYKID